MTHVFLRENFSTEPLTPTQAFLAEVMHANSGQDGRLEELENKMEGLLEMAAAVFAHLPREKQLELLNLRTAHMKGPAYKGMWATKGASL